jgi:hypothetical protein
MPRRLVSFRWRAHQSGKIEHFVEIGLELVPGQAYWSSFSLRTLLGLMQQTSEHVGQWSAAMWFTRHERHSASMAQSIH